MKWLDWLTAIGALLGTIAFFQNAFSGIAATNKAKWAGLGPDVISEDQLAQAIQQVRMPGQVNERTLTALLHLNNKLREQGDAVKFKSLWGNPYERHLAVLFEVTESFRTRLFKPEWKKHPFPDGIGSIFGLDQEHFLKQFGTRNAHAEQEKVRKQLQHDMERALHAFTAVRILANREDIEYLLPWTWRQR